MISHKKHTSYSSLSVKKKIKERFTIFNLLIVFIFAVITPTLIWAQNPLKQNFSYQKSIDSFDNSNNLFLNSASKPFLVAVNGESEDSGTEVDAYDPFTDYSEFENPEEEQQDIRFFKKGRFFTLGLYAGARFFTGRLSQYLDFRVPNVGLFLNYFLNLTSALQFSALLGSHPFYLAYDDIVPVEGSFDFYTYALDFKYHFDKERIIRALAFFNPYIIVGFTITLRPAHLFTNTVESTTSTLTGYGIRAGLGIEVFLSKRFFIGAQGDFNYTTFPDESQTIKPPHKDDPSKQVDTGIFLQGDMAHVLFIIGVNF